eukprot:XP_001705235.1 Hypothetical protein GL50803_38661 [Giardia lamblia ATCC 50803]
MLCSIAISLISLAATWESMVALVCSPIIWPMKAVFMERFLSVFAKSCIIFARALVSIVASAFCTFLFTFLISFAFSIISPPISIWVAMISI